MHNHSWVFMRIKIPNRSLLPSGTTHWSLYFWLTCKLANHLEEVIADLAICQITLLVTEPCHFEATNSIYVGGRLFFMSGQQFNKKLVILSGLNCNIVFCSISLTTMFSNKAQASRLTPICSAGSSTLCLSVVCIWRTSFDSFELRSAYRLSAPRHKTTCIFLYYTFYI